MSQLRKSSQTARHSLAPARSSRSGSSSGLMRLAPHRHQIPPSPPAFAHASHAKRELRLGNPREGWLADTMRSRRSPGEGGRIPPSPPAFAHVSHAKRELRLGNPREGWLADTMRSRRSPGEGGRIPDQGRGLAMLSICSAGASRPRIWRRASSSTSSRPARIPAIVGRTSTSATMPTRWVGALSG